MSTIAPTQPMAMPVDPVDPGWVPSPLYRMSLEKYEAMVASGAFTKRDRFHLINGYLVEKMTQYPPHASTCDAARTGARICAAGRMVSSVPDKPLRLPTQASEPEPDEVVARGPGAIIRDAIPSRLMSPWSSRSPIRAWRKTGRWPRSTAGAGVPVYWIVNLVDRQVEVYTDPVRRAATPRGRTSGRASGYRS